MTELTPKGFKVNHFSTLGTVDSLYIEIKDFELKESYDVVFGPGEDLSEETLRDKVAKKRTQIQLRQKNEVIARGLKVLGVLK